MFTIAIKNHAPWSGPLVCVLTYQKGFGPRCEWSSHSFYRCKNLLEFSHHAITSPGILWASLYWRPFPWSDAKLIGRLHWHHLVDLDQEPTWRGEPFSFFKKGES